MLDLVCFLGRIIILFCSLGLQPALPRALLQHPS